MKTLMGIKHAFFPKKSHRKYRNSKIKFYVNYIILLT